MRADYVCSKSVTQDSCLHVSQILGGAGEGRQPPFAELEGVSNEKDTKEGVRTHFLSGLPGEQLSGGGCSGEDLGQQKNEWVQDSGGGGRKSRNELARQGEGN